MHPRSRLTLAAALVALAAGAGCGGENASLSSELDESSYREGQQMERQGRWDEALTAYLKVIDRRGDAAPESNLDAGLIYLNHIKDPIYAIYHFRKYLEVEPNSKQAVYVRGLIDAAKREFARPLPGRPFESQTEHLGVEEQLERLQRENDELKVENAALRAGVPVPVVHSSSIDLTALPSPQSIAADPPPPGADAGGPAPAPEAGVAPISLAPIEADPKPADSAITDAPPEADTASPTRPAAAAGHHHVVARGDTLFSLAQKYYGNRSRWHDIFAANRAVLGTEKAPLKIGTDLKIP